MLRFFYCWLLRFHPARFRERFADEMLSIFEHAETRDSAKLVADALISLARQWTMRSDYWEEQVTASVPAGVKGFPAFPMLESFKPRKSALIEGVVLTWIAYAALFFALSHSKVHYVYVPSVTFASVASTEVRRPTSVPIPASTQGSVPARTQPATETRTNSRREDRPSLSKSTPSPPKFSAGGSAPRGQVRVNARTNSMGSSETSPRKSKSSEPDSSAGVFEAKAQANTAIAGQVPGNITPPPNSQFFSQPFIRTKIPKETLFSYVGVYSTDPASEMAVLITAQDGQLAIELPGNEKATLVQVHGVKFAFADAKDNWIEFMKHEDGAIYGLQFRRNGSEFKLLRKTN